MNSENHLPCVYLFWAYSQNRTMYLRHRLSINIIIIITLLDMTYSWYMTYVLSATIFFSANLYSLDRLLHNMALVASQGSAHSGPSRPKTIVLPKLPNNPDNFSFSAKHSRQVRLDRAERIRPEALSWYSSLFTMGYWESWLSTCYLNGDAMDHFTFQSHRDWVSISRISHCNKWPTEPTSTYRCISSCGFHSPATVHQRWFWSQTYTRCTTIICYHKLRRAPKPHRPPWLYIL